ncbi:AMP-binding protein [Polyangium aurulentum]|uniref:AMP-binding protein n=1 Tax=Polyangium aurulentum TaxID=2567896 RepID=UPI00146E60F2|nr:AMP-binding protein [Polyangium aurulentum]UQA56303.1 AMP-binding protein [Polyangium aurulentum]
MALDIPGMLRSLSLAREDDIPQLAWLDATWKDPASFWAALLDHLRRGGPPLKSKIGVASDLYADAIVRHARSGRPALVWHERRAGWRALGYADLDARAESRASAWIAQGAAAGKTIALVQDIGLEYVVDLAAALRIGAVVSILPPASDLHLAHRLAELKPDHIAADPLRPPPLGSFAKLVLDPGGRGPPPRLPPHAYGPKEPWAQLFSPARAPITAPTPVLAHKALLHGLRDGLFAFGLEAGSVFAAPGAHPTQHQPSLLLATLLAGATFLHIPADELADDPALLSAQPIDSLFITAALRDVLRARSAGRLARLRFWVKPVDEALDWTAWRDFVDRNGLAEIPAANVLVDAAEGSCVLFSTRRPASIHARALPCAAQPWRLSPVTDGGPAGEVGIFEALQGDEPDPRGWFILARSQGEYLYGSTLVPRRAARVFPSAEVEKAAAALAFAKAACVVPVPASGPGASALFVLCVFTGADPSAEEERPAREAKLRGELAQRLGPDAIPDAIAIHPLYPRMKDGEVDKGWCTRQLLSGWLDEKSAHASFQQLTALRGALLDAT